MKRGKTKVCLAIALLLRADFLKLQVLALYNSFRPHTPLNQTICNRPDSNKLSTQSEMRQFKK